LIKRTTGKGGRYGRRKIFGLNPNVFFLGLVSILTDISSEMIFTPPPPSI
jgi:hypothetical protein